MAGERRLVYVGQMGVAIRQRAVTFIERRSPLILPFDGQDDTELLATCELLRGFDVAPQLAALLEPSCRGRNSLRSLAFNEQHPAICDQTAIDVGEALECPPFMAAAWEREQKQRMCDHVDNGGLRSANPPYNNSRLSCHNKPFLRRAQKT